MIPRILASKLQVLEFIREKELVAVYDLVNRFGYTYWGAESTIQRLRRQGLVENIERGLWALTVVGYKRLEYYGR